MKELKYKFKEIDGTLLKIDGFEFSRIDIENKTIFILPKATKSEDAHAFMNSIKQAFNNRAIVIVGECKIAKFEEII